MAKARRLPLPDLIEVFPKKFEDERGFFKETYNKPIWADLGVVCDFVQDNQSVSREAGTLRGLHFQLAPCAQAKLVRVTQGQAFDVAVDLRPESETYGQWASVILDAEIGNQLYIPEGFAHGFMTLESNTHFHYKVSAFYSKEHDRSLQWNDPSIEIEWPETNGLVMSEKDRSAPKLASLEHELR